MEKVMESHGNCFIKHMATLYSLQLYSIMCFQCSHVCPWSHDKTYMVLIFLSRCRHGAIAKFFGDELPSCNKQCDYCDKKVQTLQAFEQFQQNICSTSHSQRFQGKTGIVKVSSGLDPDLYGGGRKGVKVLVFYKAVNFNKLVFVGIGLHII